MTLHKISRFIELYKSEDDVSRSHIHRGLSQLNIIGKIFRILLPRIQILGEMFTQKAKVDLDRRVLSQKCIFFSHDSFKGPYKENTFNIMN